MHGDVAGGEGWAGLIHAWGHSESSRGTAVGVGWGLPYKPRPQTLNV